MQSHDHNADQEFDRYFEIYEREFKRCREIDDNALEYFRKEVDKRYPNGDYKAFLLETEKLSTEEIKNRAKKLGYVDCHVPAGKRYTYSEVRATLFSQIKEDESTNKTSPVPSFIIDDTAWTKPKSPK